MSVKTKGRSFTAYAGTKVASSVQRQVFHCKLRNQGCSFTKGETGAVVSRCFPHPTRSLASEKTLKDPGGHNMEVRRVDLANLALRSPRKFATGVKYQFHQGF